MRGRLVRFVVGFLVAVGERWGSDGCEAGFGVEIKVELGLNE